MQLHGVKWDQQHQSDIFSPTQDLLITPPLFELKPRQTQIIRLAIQKHTGYETQQTYRVYLQEVIPEVTPMQPPLTDTLRIALNMSVPIFIEPTKRHQQFQWSAHWLDDKNIRLELRNSGNVTLFTDGWQILNTDQHIVSSKKMFQYILPYQQITWTVPLEKTSNLSIKAQINAEPTLSHVQTT